MDDRRGRRNEENRKNANDLKLQCNSYVKVQRGDKGVSKELEKREQMSRNDVPLESDRTNHRDYSEATLGQRSESTGSALLKWTLHQISGTNTSGDNDKVLIDIADKLQDHFGIERTLQIRQGSLESPTSQLDSDDE